MHTDGCTQHHKDAHSSARTEYRDVPGYPGLQVGSDGTVWKCYPRAHLKRESRGKWHRAAGTVMKSGHVRISYPCNGLRNHRPLVHRLVLLAFVGPCPDGMEGCHDDGDPGNNCVSNLRWDTHTGNMRDTLKHGTRTSSPGESNGSAKLTETQARLILVSRGAKSAKDLAREFGVSKDTVRAIWKGKKWAHLSRPTGAVS